MTSTVQISGPGEITPELAVAVWDLLVLVDNEFVPSLSSRSSTTSKSLSTPNEQRRPQAYYEHVLGQWNALACEDQQLVGVASFIVHHQEPTLPGWCPCTYLSTIAVDPARRQAGAGRLLYQHLVDFSRSAGDRAVVTRTWSANTTHLALLGQMEFSEVARLADHRGPGIDTVYFARAHT